VETVNPWRWLRKDRPVVHQVTDAQPSLRDDMRKREISYLVKMGIRLVCLILAVALPAPWPVKGLLVAGAGDRSAEGPSPGRRPRRPVREVRVKSSEKGATPGGYGGKPPGVASSAVRRGPGTPAPALRRGTRALG
jgi:hypothetical protein